MSKKVILAVLGPRSQCLATQQLRSIYISFILYHEALLQTSQMFGVADGVSIRVQEQPFSIFIAISTLIDVKEHLTVPLTKTALFLLNKKRKNQVAASIPTLTAKLCKLYPLSLAAHRAALLSRKYSIRPISHS